MAITVVQRVSGIAVANSAGAFGITITQPTSGNLIVAVGASRDSAAGPTIGGITGWSLLDEELNIGTDGMSIRIWYRIAAAGLGTSVTMTPGASSKPGIYFTEASSDVGWDFAGNPPKFASTNGSGTSGSTGTTLTTAVATALGVGAIVGEGNVAGFTSWLNSFTERADLDATSASGNRIFLGAADLIISTIGTKSTGATLGASVPWAGVIGVFEEMSAGTEIDTSAARFRLRAGATDLDLTGLVVDTTASRFRFRAATTTVAAAAETVDTTAARFVLRSGTTSLALTGATIDTAAARLAFRAGITTVDIPVPGGDCDGLDPIAMQMAKGRPFAPTSWGAFGPSWLKVRTCEDGPVTVSTAAARFALRAAVTEVDAGATTIDTTAARFALRAGTTSVETTGQTVATDAARFRLRSGTTTLELGQVTVSTEGGRFVLRAGVTGVEVGATQIDTDASRVVFRAGVTSVIGGTIVLPHIDCDIASMGVDCGVSALGVESAILALAVDCEVL